MSLKEEAEIDVFPRSLDWTKVERLKYAYDSLLYLIASRALKDPERYNRKITLRRYSSSVLRRSRIKRFFKLDFNSSYILDIRRLPFVIIPRKTEWRKSGNISVHYTFDIAMRIHGSDGSRDIVICEGLYYRLGRWFAGKFNVPDDHYIGSPWAFGPPEKIVPIKGNYDIPDGFSLIPEVMIHKSSYINWALILHDVLAAYLAEYQPLFPSPIELPYLCLNDALIIIPGFEAVPFDIPDDAKDGNHPFSSLFEYGREFKHRGEYFIAQERMRNAIRNQTKILYPIYGRREFPSRYHDDYSEVKALRTSSKAAIKLDKKSIILDNDNSDYIDDGDTDNDNHHPSGYTNPSPMIRIGDACNKLGMGCKESTVSSFSRTLKKHPDWACPVPDKKGFYWFNRDHSEDYKKAFPLDTMIYD